MSKKKTNIFGLGLFLAIICAVATGLLALVDRITREPIEKGKLADMNKALKEVLPGFDNIPSEDTVVFKAKSGTPVNFYIARKDGKIVGVAGKSYSKGYAGKVVAMVGMNTDGTIRTVIITDQKETPGLGTVVADRVRVRTIFDVLGMGKKEDTSKLPPNPILDQFDGHKAGDGDSWPIPWKVQKDGGKAKYITGATITSRAVTNATYEVAETYMENRKKILDTPIPGGDKK